MDEEYQAGTKGLEYACEKGLSVVVMEPLRGGKLTVKVPEDVKAIWDNAPIKRTPAEWGLRWVANHPQVTTILSGMSNMQQVEENLKILGQAKANELSGEELAIIEKAAETYRARNLYGCTNCKYCMPCTQEISIPDVIDARNEAGIYDEKMHGVFAVNVLLDHKPSECIECGVCEPKCPQHLPIIKIMKEAAELFERK
jgi:predicted aldo/keto reductase-like oxidoreductase